MTGSGLLAAALEAINRHVTDERQKDLVLMQRLDAFKHSESARQTATAQRSVTELNALAYHACERMLRASIEASAESPQGSNHKGRCQ